MRNYIKLKPNGSFHHFTYPDYGTPDGYPDHTAHSGQTVRIIRPLNRDECDEDSWPTYQIRARDGWIGTACHEELKAVKPTSQDIEAAFFLDLEALKDKYPMCYIESWTPGDFDSIVKKASSSWLRTKHVETANKLGHNFDAGLGTNWDRVFEAAE